MFSLTRTTIENMEAGPEADTLIVTRVLKQELYSEPPVGVDEFFLWPNAGEHASIRRFRDKCYEIWSPSTDIVAAWEVVEHLQQDNDIQIVLSLSVGETDIEIGSQHWRVEIESVPTAPLAICKAALLSTLEDSQ